MRVLLERLADVFLSRSRDRRLDEEVRLHLDLLERDLIERGYAPEAARLEARRQFGGVDQVRILYRDQRARGAHLWRLVAGTVLVSAAAGVIVGGAGGFAIQRAMRGVLTGDDGDGAAALPILGFVILAVVGLACAVPMRRALRVDPATALRAE